MGCTASSPFKEYYLGLERKKKCDCQCHQTQPHHSKPLDNRIAPSTDLEMPKEDPRIPLSGRQIFLIKRSWKGISRNMRETGINMFLSLFEKNKEVMRFFTGLNTEDISELRGSKLLENHVKGVMLTIDEAITNMDDADTIIDMLLYVGKSHLRFEGFDPNVFMLIKDPFLLAVKDTLGDRYTAHMEEIYGKAIEFILTTLIAGFTSNAKQAAPPSGFNSIEAPPPPAADGKNGYGAASYGSSKPGTSNAE